jgi:translation initiation factor IF-1
LAKEDLAMMEGIVTDVLAGGNFSVQVQGGKTVLAKLSGRLRKFHIRVIPGDSVSVGISPYDLSHGLILGRKILEGGSKP